MNKPGTKIQVEISKSVRQGRILAGALGKWVMIACGLFITLMMEAVRISQMLICLSDSMALYPRRLSSLHWLL
jgi:hypothetical protein